MDPRAVGAGVLDEETGRTERVRPHAADIDSGGGHLAADPAAEGVVAEGGDPAGGYAVVGEVHRHIGFGAREADSEPVGVLQRRGGVRHQRGHGLADAGHRGPDGPRTPRTVGRGHAALPCR